MSDDRRAVPVSSSYLYAALDDNAALLARAEKLERERDALAEAFDGEFPLAPDEWVEVRNAWKRRAEKAEADLAAEQRGRAQDAEVNGQRIVEAEAREAKLRDAVERVVGYLNAQVKAHILIGPDRRMLDYCRVALGEPSDES